MFKHLIEMHYVFVNWLNKFSFHGELCIYNSDKWNFLSLLVNYLYLIILFDNILNIFLSTVCQYNLSICP